MVFSVQREESPTPPKPPDDGGAPAKGNPNGAASTPVTGAIYLGKESNSNPDSISNGISLYGDWITVNKGKRGQRQGQKKDKVGKEIIPNKESNRFLKLRQEVSQHPKKIQTKDQCSVVVSEHTSTATPKVWLRKRPARSLLVRFALKNHLGPLMSCPHGPTNLLAVQLRVVVN
ncbi:Nuclear GTPase SLIP-GC [Sesbania bispinosa]|nr:Nuclear GTPase SLIP-GC [Sesbania bispinosa]